jgi:hypothetical protein
MLDMIDWDAHCLALKKQNKRREHYTKLVFDILPTMNQLNKFDNGRRHCPACQTMQEDNDHILRWLASRCVTWRIEFMDDSLKEFCRKMQTDPELHQKVRNCKVTVRRRVLE